MGQGNGGGKASPPKPPSIAEQNLAVARETASELAGIREQMAASERRRLAAEDDAMIARRYGPHFRSRWASSIPTAAARSACGSSRCPA
jgi:hypothetical protein